MGLLRAFCGPWAGHPLGLVVMFCALASPILLALGGSMLAVHKPHTLVASEGVLYAVQMDFFDHNVVMPEHTATASTRLRVLARTVPL